MKLLTAGLLMTLGLVAMDVGTAAAGSSVVYIHGRSMGGWTKSGGAYTNLITRSGWTNVFLEFDGSAAVNDGAINTQIKNAIASSCSGGNTCVLMCYSTGCLRTLRAVSELRTGGNTLPGLLWAEGVGSAAGGTALAELSTQGLTGLLAKLLGQQEKADFDLTRAAANDTWGYVQDDMPVTLYHVGGNKDTCKSLAFIKLCGGSFIPGVDDGVVGLDSAAGAAKRADGTYPGISDACTVARYPFRAWEYGASSCGGVVANHAEVPSFGASRASTRLAGSASTALFNWGNATGTTCNRTLAASNTASCDQPYASGEATDFAAATGASANEQRTSDTYTTTPQGSCYGRCGGSAGSCWCDAYAWNTGGNVCGDYVAANCDDYNNLRRGVFRGVNGAGVYRAYIDLDQARAWSGTNPVTVPFYIHPTDQGGMLRLYRCGVAGGAERLASTSGSACPTGTTLEQLGWIAVSPNGAYTTSVYLRELQKSIGGVVTYIYTLSTSERDGLVSQGWTSNGSIGAAWTN